MPLLFRNWFQQAVLALLLYSCLVSICVASVLLTGQTVALNGVDYYIPPSPVSPFSSGLFPDGEELVPLTVFSTSTLEFNGKLYEKKVAEYLAQDDVFQTGFLQSVYIVYDGNMTTSKRVSMQISVDTTTKLRYNTNSISAYPLDGTIKPVPPGPYFFSKSKGALYEAYRLYSDSQGAFTQGLIQGSNGNYSVLPAALPGVHSLTIGVPSRLYYPKSEALPLNGVRLGVKDIYNIAGVRTGCGNRAYYELYPEKNATAPAVQKLIDAGAVIIGKMKTSQFANGETATADWVDYHSPFNARGDGYQDPSSSSSGPGAGAGAYPWLDLTLGSDTGGSIRGPSQSNGLFGNRPSYGLVDLDDVMPLAPQLDTAGFLCRDPALWRSASEVLYSGLVSYGEFPKKIMTYSFPTAVTSEADSVLLDFLAKLQKLLSANVTTFDYDAAWNATKPAFVSTTLDDMLNLTYPMLIGKEQVQRVRNQFYEDYAALYDGRRPFIDPSPLARWNWSDTYPASSLTDAVANKTIFKNWWNTKVIRNSSTTCSDSILLYVGADGSTTYRNTYRDPPSIPTGFGISRISNFAEVPDFVVPVGEATYNSTVTLHNETLPVAVDIVAAKGCDGMIFDLVEKMVESGIIKAVGTGTNLYGDNQILV